MKTGGGAGDCAPRMFTIVEFLLQGEQLFIMGWVLKTTKSIHGGVPKTFLFILRKVLGLKAYDQAQ